MTKTTDTESSPPVPEPLPLLPSQLRFWLIDKVAPDRPQAMRVFYRISGELDVQVLRNSINEIVRRHEALRLNFVMQGGDTYQIIRDPYPVDLPLTDLSAFQEQEREDRSVVIAHDMSTRPFSLESDSPLRVHLVKLESNEHVLLTVVHHVAFDAWSRGVFLEDLGQIYGALRGDGSAHPPPLNLTYRDLVKTQHERMASEKVARSLEYWRSRLSGVSSLALPYDFARTRTPSFVGSVFSHSISSDLTTRLRRLATARRTTLFVVLLTAFKVLLSRYTQQTDVTVATPFAGRSTRGAEKLIGLFINTLLLRTNFDGNPSIDEAINRVQATVLDAHDHQHIPFELLEEELRSSFGPEKTPFDQVMFQMLPSTSEVSFSNLTLRPLGPAGEQVRLDLETHVTERQDDLQITIRFRRDLFQDSTITRLFSHFERVLQAVVQNSKQRISEVSLLFEKELQTILVEWNRTEAPFPLGHPIHELFEKRVTISPDKVALATEGLAVSYESLNAQANQLARYLRKKGLETEQLVGVLMDRGLDMITGVLATLKAGGAYLPLDPDYPAKRLAYMLDDSGARFLLTRESFADRVPSNASVLKVDLESEAESIALESVSNLPGLATPESLAYVIYTSGSTGQPKGVEICHLNLVNLTFAQIEAFRIAEDDKILQFAPFSFDASVSEIFTTIIAGATLVIPSTGTVRVGRELSELIREEEITVATLPPSVLRTLPQLPMPTLKTLIVAGEPCPPDLVNWWTKSKRVLNAYGPTEATVCASIEECYGEYSTSPPIGRPIANTWLYILDQNLHPVPIGVPGEIFIGGLGVARGYRNKPDLTSASFLPNPFVGTSDSRMYRTGDLGRFTDRGAVEFLGRIDEQAKVRGYRVEPGEVEVALLETGLVKESAVVGLASDDLQPSLAAMVVPKSEWSGLKDDEETLQVEAWKSSLDDLHVKSEESSEVDSDFRGWTSAYNRRPIAQEEMLEWVETTADRIRQLEPRQVLEIGCGTGLLVFRLSHQTSKYVATDFSRPAVELLSARLAMGGITGGNVTILEREALDLTGLDTGEFDLVILNSVTQFFPSRAYLERVLDGCIAAASEDSHVFIGDVRSLPLLEPFAVTVQLHSATSKDVRSFFHSVQKSLIDETELVIHPDFFLDFASRTSVINHVEILPKRGHARNELTSFRYDVILHIGTRKKQRPNSWTEWKDVGTLKGLSDLMSQGQEVVTIANIPEPRTHNALRAATITRVPTSLGSLEELRLLVGTEFDEGVHVEALFEVASTHGYDVRLNWVKHEGGVLDAAFLKRAGRHSGALVEFPRHQIAETQSLTNDPLFSRYGGQFVTELRRRLRDRLPDFMIPSSFDFLAALPATPAGKIDRMSLSQMRGPLATRRAETLDDPIQEMVATTWEDFLDVQVGPEDDFFELGGHSLLATDLMAQLSEAFGLDLPVRILFESPTVSELASVIRQARSDLGGREVPPLRAEPRDDLMPASYEQHWMLVLNRMRGPNAFLMHSGRRIKEALDVSALQDALYEFVGRHEPLRSSFTRKGGRFFQRVNTPRPMALDLIDLSFLSRAKSEQRVYEIGRELSRQPFDIFSDESLVHTQLVKVDQEDYVLFVTVPEIACDAVSLYLLRWEIERLYRDLMSTGHSTLPPLPIQYGDYAAWQQKWMTIDALSGHLEYWSRKLDGLKGLELPDVRPSSTNSDLHKGSAIQAIRVPSSVIRGLREFAKREGATTFMVLATAFKVLLALVAQTEDVVVGTVVANRNRPELKGLIGFFANIVLLRTTIELRATLRDATQRVKQTALEGYAHQDLPYSVLLSRAPSVFRDRSGGAEILFQLIQPVGLPSAEDGPSQWENYYGNPKVGDVVRFPTGLGVDLEWRVSISRTDEALVRVLYRTDLFKDSSIKDLLQGFSRVCEAFAHDGRMRISSLGHQLGYPV